MPDHSPPATLVQSAIDELDGYIDGMFEVTSGVNCKANTENIDQQSGVHPPSDDCDFTSEQPMRTEAGARIEVFWPEDHQYYAGAVTDVKDDGRFVVVYDDDETETSNMTEETWRFEQPTLLASVANVDNVFSRKYKKWYE